MHFAKRARRGTWVYVCPVRNDGNGIGEAETAVIVHFVETKRSQTSRALHPPDLNQSSVQGLFYPLIPDCPVFEHSMNGYDVRTFGFSREARGHHAMGFPNAVNVYAGGSLDRLL